MKKITLLALVACLCAQLSAQQTFKNPIIPGYHPDPSICRVGDTFYLVNSSFSNFPGVPLYESRDLIHWTHSGNVLTREEQLPLDNASSWLGIYAPTIRYNEGIFYMITTNVGNGGNFLVTSTDARIWSDPIWVAQEGIDPSLYFEDGKTYMCSNPDGAIWLCEIDPATGEQLTESKYLWGGDGGRYPEGPHIYKKDGWYYLLVSEGGTELAHHLTIARSRDIYGPYESNPANPILTNCSQAGQEKQIQGVGHGDLVQAADGSWWMVFLAYRNFGGSYHHLGRETCLAPVEWPEGEWPVVNGGLPIDTVMTAKLLPQVEECETDGTQPMTTDRAQLPIKPTGRLAPDSPAWIHLQNPVKENYEWIATVPELPGRLRPDDEPQAIPQTILRLHPSSSTLEENVRPTFIGVRQEDANCLFEATVDLNHMGEGNVFGLTAYQISDGHFDLYVTKDPGEEKTVAMKYRLKSVEGLGGKAAVSADKIILRISSDGLRYYFDYSENGKDFHRLAAHDCSLLSTEVVGGFTGVLLGLYASGQQNDAYADFSKLTYKP